MSIFTLFFVVAVINTNKAALVPMDAVEVSVWRQPDLSGRFFVDEDTTIKLPLLGQIDLKTKTLDSLRVELFNLYENYLGPTFLVINFYYRISILGEVKKPGIYYISNNDNIPNLLATAEGVTERGNLRKVRVLRFGTEQKLNVEAIIKQGDPENKLSLQPGDLVIVPRRTLPTLQELSIIISALALSINIYTAFFK